MDSDPLDPDALDAALAEAFDGSPGERRAVVRQATDLHDAGRYREDSGGDADSNASTPADNALTVETIVEHLADAPRGSVADRWNWWVAALEAAYGGYSEFEVRRYRE